jgi:hypothetical protein
VAVAAHRQALGDRAALQFGHAAQHGEHELAVRRRRVKRLGRALETHAVRIKRFVRVQQHADTAGEAIQTVDGHEFKTAQRRVREQAGAIGAVGQRQGARCAVVNVLAHDVPVKGTRNLAQGF